MQCFLVCLGLATTAALGGCAHRAVDTQAAAPAQPAQPAQPVSSAASALPDPVSGTLRTSGVYAVEYDAGVPFRWTDGHAVIDGPHSDRPPRALHLVVAALKPTPLTITVDGALVAKRVVAAGTSDLNLALSRSSSTPNLRLDSPTFRPPAPPMRTLGIQIRALSYASALAPVDLVLDADSPAALDGFYAVENSALGFRFRWTKGHASVGIPASAPRHLVLKLRSELPESSVRLRLDRQELEPVKLARGEVAERRIDVPAGAHHLLIDVPEWTPPAVNGFTRPLGVEVLGLTQQV